MSSEIWWPGDRSTYREVDIRNREACDLCPALNRNRAVLDPSDPSKVIATVPLCDTCHGVIPEYPNMGRNGYQSYAVDHVHLVEMGVTHPGRKIVNRRLCRGCKAEDYRIAYPNNPVPRELLDAA